MAASRGRGGYKQRRRQQLEATAAREAGLGDFQVDCQRERVFLIFGTLLLNSAQSALSWTKDVGGLPSGHRQKTPL